MATEVMTTENGKKEDSVAEIVSGVDISDSELIKDSKDYSKDGEGGDVVTPNGRPVRERKAVDRFWISSSAAQSFATKPLSIAKGSGTPLKDIPNVAFKLSKRKPDDTLQLLHLILFGKRAKAHNLKKDIGLFSGFVWEANEEKQRAKMKERLDKLVKEKLFDFCDVLNIPIFKSVKKEDISVKLLEFLESPHATTEVLLADKEQKSKKRKRSVKSSKRSKKASGEKSAKKTQSREKRKRSSMSEENETDDMDDKMSSQSYSSGEEDDASLKQDSDQEQPSSDEEKDEGNDKTSPKESSKDNSEAKSGTKIVNMKCSSEKFTKSPATSAKKSKETPNNSKSSKKTKDMPNNSKYSKKTKEASKKQKVDEETKSKKSVSTDKSPSKKARKSAKSEGGEEERNEEDKVEPTKEELHDVAVNILKEVDFNTATISDILRLLGSHFGLDLMHRKSEVKAVIQEVLESMSGGDSDGGEDDDNEEEDDEDDDNKEEDGEDDKDSGEE